jgi:hypothetical protein
VTVAGATSRLSVTSVTGSGSIVTVLVRTWDFFVAVRASASGGMTLGLHGPTPAVNAALVALVTYHQDRGAAWRSILDAAVQLAVMPPRIQDPIRARLRRQAQVKTMLAAAILLGAEGVLLDDLREFYS